MIRHLCCGWGVGALNRIRRQEGLGCPRALFTLGRLLEQGNKVVDGALEAVADPQRGPPWGVDDLEEIAQRDSSQRHDGGEQMRALGRPRRADHAGSFCRSDQVLEMVAYPPFLLLADVGACPMGQVCHDVVCIGWW